jgi:hypothetical protein
MLALTLLSAALLTAAACNSNGNNTGSGGNAATPPPATSAADNTEEVCTAAEKVITDGMTTFSTELQKALAAATSGDEAAVTQSINAVKTLFTGWQQGLRAEADKATNTELKTALNTFADEIQKVVDQVKTADDLENLDMESAEMTAASDTLERICG